MNEIKKTQQLITEIVEWVKTTPWKADYQVRLERMIDMAEKPCVLAIAGKVKAGKSSFLNSLLGVDLAAVGTTETTATINVFKYGQPKDLNKPVVVYWNDGREPETKNRDFIDSLQGYSEEVLKKSEMIDHLEYLIDDDRLKDVTLVDTPGFGSVVGEHEERIESYFSERIENLRNRQVEQSNVITEKADAVIFISGPVAQANAQKFFGERIPYISPFNAVGAMTKIDMIQPEKVEQKATVHWMESISAKANELTERLSESFEHDLHTVLPVSASVYHIVNKMRDNGELESLQKSIRMIPQDIFEIRFDQNEGNWKQNEGGYQNVFSKCRLTHNKRIEMVGDMPWKTFCLISIALYYLSIEEAVDFLINMSGMERVKKVLDERFFCRSRSIRCASVLRDVQNVLAEIKNCGIPKILTDSKSKDDFLNVIEYARGKQFNDMMLNSFEVFVKKNIPDASFLDRYSDEIDSLLMKTADLLQEMQISESLNEGQTLLKNVQTLLRNQEERDELELLLSGNPDRLDGLTSEYCNQRQRFWRGRMLRVAGNKDFSRLLSIVCNNYGNLLKIKK